MDHCCDSREHAKSIYPSGDDDWEGTLRVETLTTQAPSNAVKAEGLSVFLGGRCLLAGADLTVAEQSRLVEIEAADGKRRTARRGTCYGLVGPNGCGKSTLLKLLADGHVPTPSAWEVMLVGQHLPMCLDRTPIDEVISADRRRAALLEEHRLVEDGLSAAADSSATLGDLLLEASHRLEEIEQQLDCWAGAEEDIARILLALGFRRPTSCEGPVSVPTLATSMQHLSGGWRMKVQLAKALWLKPKLLLLDEPTNHLDFEALRWLEGQLDEYPHTTIVVSHGVAFLHEVCREIFWIKDRKIESMPRDVLSQEDLARMQRTKALNFRFAVADGGPPQDHGVSVHNVQFSYPSAASGPQTASKALSIEGHVRFSGQSRAVMLGKNGSGKSTFLAMCAGKLQPSRGSVDRTPGCRIGHYDQQMDEIDRHSELTAVEYLIQECCEPLEARLEVKTRAAQRTAQRRGGKVAASALQKRLAEVARGVLSGFGFEGDLAIALPVGRLSGGQKARLKLAVLSLRPAHILFLDEPTNHLDAEACEALAEGLSKFEGGVVVVTHDDLLIYHLIQCNWARSELLTCQAGQVQCRKEFGGQCLKSLREQVRRSEAGTLCDEDPRPPPPKTTAKPPDGDSASGPAKLPPWLTGLRARPRVARCGEEAAPATRETEGVVLDTKVPQRAVSVSSVASPARLSRRIGARQETVPRCSSTTEKPEKTAQRMLREHTEAGKSSASTGQPRVVPALSGSGVRQAISVAARPTPLALLPYVPDRWDEGDDHEEDGSDGVGSVGTDAVGSDYRHNVNLVAAVCPQHIAPRTGEGCCGEGPRRSLVAAGGSNHSRFRKDLVNLNKGAAKWMAKEQEGLLTRDEVVRRIRNSSASRHLADVRGEEYQEVNFVQDVIARAQAAGRGGGTDGAL